MAGGLPSSLTGQAPSFGSPGAPGFISPFDQGAFQDALTKSMTAMTEQYHNLGLGGVGATPSANPVGAKPGVPGSGTTATNPGSFAPGSTAMRMDLGQAPSLVGGIPAQVEAGLGQQQTADLGATSASAQAAIQGKNQQTGFIGQGLGALGNIL